MCLHRSTPRKHPRDLSFLQGRKQPAQGSKIGRGLDDSVVASTSRDMTTGEVDKRVRVGEALGQTFKRCGDTLGGYGRLSPRLLLRRISDKLTSAFVAFRA